MNPRTLTPSISLLLAFEAAARHQSYTQAAFELSLTQSAVSRQVQTLENLLGVQLFQRKGRHIELTDVGRVYAGEVGMAIRRIRNATFQTMAFRPLGGSFNLASLPTFGAKWLLPRLHDFYAAHPQTLIHLHSRIGRFDLDSAVIDAVISVSDQPWPNLVSHKIMDEELVLIASPRLVERHPIHGINDLAALPLLCVATRANVWSEWFDACQTRPKNLCPGPTFEITSHLIQAVATGIGVGLVPRCLVEEELGSGQLVTPISEPYRSGMHYFFAYPSHKENFPPLAAFRDWLLAGRTEEEKEKQGGKRSQLAAKSSDKGRAAKT